MTELGSNLYTFVVLQEEAIMGKRVLTAYERAFEDGEMNTKLETARRMKDEGFNLGQILKITGLSENQLRDNGIL